MKGPLGKLKLMIGRARLLLSGAGKAPRVQIEILSGEILDLVPHLQDYGFASRPLPGAEGVSLAVAGTRGQAVVITLADRRFRVELEEGEAALHDDQGQTVWLKRDGIRVESPLKVEIAAPEIALQAETSVAVSAPQVTLTADDLIRLEAAKIVLLSDDVNLGAEGGLQAARKTDAVAGGVITGGSTKVRIA